MRRAALALTTALAVAAVLGGWGLPRPARTEQPDVVRAVRSIQAVGADRAAVPAGFAAAMGYRPVGPAPGPTGARVGHRAGAGCSSPFGPTRYGFGDACRRHDLGYDLLRYAAVTGMPLAGWARRAVDDRFAAEVRARCRHPACRLAASGYVAAVRLNSFRQGWGVPVVESPLRLSLPGAAGLLAGAALWSDRARRRLAATARVLAGLRGRHVTAAAGLALGVQPVMLPRPLWVQGLFGGALAAQGYLLGTAGAVTAGRLRAPRWAAPAAAGLIMAAAIGGLVAGQSRVALATGAPVPPVGAAVLAVLLAGAVGALLVRLGRAAARVPRRLARARRRVGIALLVPVLALGGASGAQAATGPGAAGPGPKGEEFIAATPTADTLARAGGGPAKAPLRLYVGLDQASGPRARAALAAAELERSGGLDRAALLLIVPTGSGWANPAAATALEYLYAGDTASVAVQYAAVPSWVAYLRGGDGVRATVRELLAAVDARLARRPAAQRPRVLLYGESLGAWGGLTAYRRPDGVSARSDGALWTGVPAGAPPAAGPGQAVLVHPDDPVPAWSPALLVRPSPAWPHRWLPLVTFWQVSADVVASAAGTGRARAPLRCRAAGGLARAGAAMAAPRRPVVGSGPLLPLDRARAACS